MEPEDHRFGKSSSNTSNFWILCQSSEVYLELFVCCLAYHVTLPATLPKTENRPKFYPPKKQKIIILQPTTKFLGAYLALSFRVISGNFREDGGENNPSGSRLLPSSTNLAIILARSASRLWTWRGAKSISHSANGWSLI